MASIIKCLSPLINWESGLLQTGCIVAFSFLVVARRYWQQQQNRRKREETLEDWIANARAERDGKAFHVLTLPLPAATTVEHHETPFGANETTRRIGNKTLDMLKNIVFLSHRCRKYGRAEQVNAITEELYDEAYHKAQTLLSKSTTVHKNKPLYGVPISVKDCIAIQGTFATGGMACRLKKKSTHNSVVVDLLEQAGAIPLCRGNAMQLMYLLESHNRIWGRTCNPWDLSRTPGGSSGGDAALVAMDCVPLAVATDMGGSIRIPAAFCGVIGFKPTSNRVSAKGNTTPRKVR
jgi:Asp-tRNA(Asn)/Glu-tRNA(Gln) amidotransferase A subunit family amidase